MEETSLTVANTRQHVSDQIPVTAAQDIDCGKVNENSELAPTSVSSSFEICKTLQILVEGKKKIVLNEEYKNLTLVIGNTGAGKSTFAQWIVGDNEKLISKEVKEGTAEYVIEDGNRISNSNSTAESQTIFPELVLDHETHSAYYDCPGFMNTRSTSHDIATTYFIKKVADHAESVKLLLVVSYPSVRKGVDRQDFLTLLRHTTDLLKNVDKFRNSVAMVVTKVENRVIKVGKSYWPLSEEIIIGAIGDFLKDLQFFLRKGIKNPNLSEKMKEFHQKSVSLLDALLIKDGENYKRIGIFRRPDEPGPLSNISLLREGKENILKILNNLQFIQVRDDDFGYTVSEKSKNDINGLVDVINKNEWSLLSNLVQNVKLYYGDLVDAMTKEMKNIDTRIEIDSVDATTILDQLDTGENVTKRLLDEVKDVNADILAIKINETIGTLGIVRSEADLSNIVSYGRFYGFLQKVGDIKFNSKPWEMLLREIPEYLTKAKIKIEADIIAKTQTLENNIHSNVQLITSAVKKHYQTRMISLDATDLILELRKGRDLMRRMNQEMKSLKTAQELSQTIRDFILFMNVMDISEIRKLTTQILHFGESIQYLQSIGHQELSEPHSWTILLGESEKFLEESMIWHTFLSDLSSKLSKHIGQTYQSPITETNLSEFWNAIKELSVAEYDIVRNMEVSGLQLEELNNVIGQTGRGNDIRKCDGEKLVMKADYIKFSDFVIDDGSVSTGCSACVNTIQIFATDTLAIDRDLQAIGRKLNIIAFAPKWDIIGLRVIDLSGVDGKEHYASKNNSGESAGESGQNGLAGKPGGSAGSFFGLGAEFLGGSNLTIIANGGNGGRGQDGGDGVNGSDGKTPPTDIVEYYERNYKCDETLCNGGSDNRIRGFNCYYEDDIEGGRVFGEIVIFGKSGGRGGNGGSGGVGGIGGDAGDVSIISLASDANFSVTVHPGERGAPGNGGGKGVGGKKGGDVFIYCGKSMFLEPFWSFGSLDYDKIHNINNKEPSSSGEDGEDGILGGNVLGLDSPEEPVFISGKPQILNDYIYYLMENLNNSNNLLRKNAPMEFPKSYTGVPVNRRLGRRSVGSRETPASSSAGRPSSWIKNTWILAKYFLTDFAVSVGAIMGSIMDVAYPMASDDRMPGNGPFEVNKHITLNGHSSMSCDVKQGSTVLEMGDLLVNNTDINGLLIWGILVAMKWTGRSPKTCVSRSYEKSVEIILDIRSRELVDELMEMLQKNVKVLGINALGILNDPEFYEESLKIVRRMLVKGDLESMTNLIFEQIKKVISKSSMRIGEVNEFLETVKRELPIIILEVASTVECKGNTRN